MESEYRRESSERLTSLDYRSWRDRWFDVVCEPSDFKSELDKNVVHYLNGIMRNCDSNPRAGDMLSIDWSLVTCLECLKRKLVAPVDDAEISQDHIDFGCDLMSAI